MRLTKDWTELELIFQGINKGGNFNRIVMSGKRTNAKELDELFQKQ